MKFQDISPKIANNSGFKNLKEIKEAGYRIVKERPACRDGYGAGRDGDRYFLAGEEDLKPLLVRLGDVAEVRRGFTTGCNEFFYLPSKHFDIKKDGKYYELIPKYEGLPRGIKIEEEYLRPVIKSSRECKGFQINPANLKQTIFMPTTKSIEKMEAYKYIRWGESKGFDKVPTCSSRLKWWYLGDRRIPSIISSCSVAQLYRAFDNKGVFADKRLYEIYSKNEEKEQLLLSLCSTLTSLFLEVGSRTGLGLGLLDLTVYELANCLIINLKFLYGRQIENKIREANGLIELGIDQTFPIREQPPNPLPDRKALDDIVFDILGLTQGEQNEVYWAVCELVKNRLDKARSV